MDAAAGVDAARSAGLEGGDGERQPFAPVPPLGRPAPGDHDPAGQGPPLRPLPPVVPRRRPEGEAPPPERATASPHPGVPPREHPAVVNGVRLAPGVTVLLEGAA